VARIRRTDPRPFPCLAVYAVEDEIVIGQVGVFRLPMISTEGREDVGGVWAVSTHPNHAGRGVATRLLEEAHTRMRPAGLRFGQARMMSLLAALTLFVHNTYGFRHRELLPQVADLLGSDYSTHQLSYDLRRLRLKGMIWRIPNSQGITMENGICGGLLAGKARQQPPTYSHYHGKSQRTLEFLCPSNSFRGIIMDNNYL